MGEDRLLSGVATDDPVGRRELSYLTIQAISQSDGIPAVISCATSGQQAIFYASGKRSPILRVNRDDKGWQLLSVLLHTESYVLLREPFPLAADARFTIGQTVFRLKIARDEQPRAPAVLEYGDPGSGTPSEIVLGGGADVAIGRDPAADIHLADDTVSREHARLLYRGGRYWVDPLFSPNGVFLRMDDVVRIESEAVIRVGKVLFRLSPSRELPPRNRFAPILLAKDKFKYKNIYWFVRDLTEDDDLDVPDESQEFELGPPGGKTGTTPATDSLANLLAMVPNSGSYAEQAQGLEELSQGFRRGLAARVGPIMKSYIHSMPHETHDEKKALVKWANAELRRFGLAIKSPKTGKPSNFVTDKGNHPEKGRFQLRSEGEGGRIETFSTPELPALLGVFELVEAPLREEGLVNWADKAKKAASQTKPRR